MVYSQPSVFINTAFLSCMKETLEKMLGVMHVQFKVNCIDNFKKLIHQFILVSCLRYIFTFLQLLTTYFYISSVAYISLGFLGLRLGIPLIPFIVSAFIY